jgi:hypothetical protein
MELKLNNIEFLRLSNKVNELNKKLEKLKLNLIELTFTQKTLKNNDSVVFMYMCKLNVPQLKLNDWELVSHIEFINNVAFSKTRKDVEIPLKYIQNLELARSCEHCNTNRRRNNTYVVLNRKTNEFKIVGSECLKDFTGHKSPEAYLKIYNNIFSFLDEPYSVGYKYSPSMTPLELLSFAFMIVREMGGFYSKKKAEEQNIPSTSYFINLINYRYNSNEYILELKKYFNSFKDVDVIDTGCGNNRQVICNNIPKISIIDKDVKMAQDVLNYINTLKNNNEYLFNIINLSLLDFIPESKFSYFISIIGGYLEKIKEEKTKENNHSEYISKVGDKISEYVQVLSVVYFKKNLIYDYTTVTMQNSQGNILVWFASGSYNFTKKDFFLIKGKVIEHKEYKSVKQTVIKNCRVITDENSERIFKIKTLEND